MFHSSNPSGNVLNTATSNACACSGLRAQLDCAMAFIYLWSLRFIGLPVSLALGEIGLRINTNL